LLGASEENKALCYGWRAAENEPAIVWAVLLAEALRRLRVFDEKERLRRVEKAALRRRCFIPGSGYRRRLSRECDAGQRADRFGGIRF
jgi:hypothetical protein